MPDLKSKPWQYLGFRIFDSARHQPPADGMAGAADDFREPRPRLDRIGDAPRLDEGAAAALGAHQAAFRQRRDGAAHRVAVDAEAVGDIDLARKLAARLEVAAAIDCSISSATRRHSVTPAVAAGARRIAVPRKLLMRFMSAVMAASRKLHHRPLGELSNNIDNSAMTDTQQNNSSRTICGRCARRRWRCWRRAAPTRSSGTSRDRAHSGARGRSRRGQRAGDGARPDRRRRRAVQFRRSHGVARRRPACDRRNRLRLCARPRPHQGAADRAVRRAGAERRIPRSRRARRAGADSRPAGRRAQAKAEQVAATKVEFFTLVRGEG